MANGLDSFVDALPALVWSARPDGSAEFFNQRYLEFVGLTAEEVSGWGWTRAVHPDDLAGLAATWQDILASGAPGEAEARLRGNGGEYRWFLFRANPVRGESGEIVRWLGVNADIEDRRQAEDALRRSQRFLLEVQRLSHTGGWRFDVASDIVESSPEIQRFYDIQPGEEYTRPPFWFERIHPEDRARVEAEFNRCLTTHTDYQAAYRILLPSGHVRYQNAVGHPIVNEAGELVEFIGASMDMTEHWEAMRELERASAALHELREAMSRAAQVATIGEMAVSIAHEVQQPLAGIVMNANAGLRMLAGDSPDVAGAQETLRRTLRDGNRAAEVITRIRALFGKKPFTYQPIDLTEAVHDVIALAQGDLQRGNVALHTQLAEDLPSIMGDRIQIQQVVLNLIRNATDAMATVQDRPRDLEIRTEREGNDHVRMSVSDTGVGIERGNTEKVFDPFYTTKDEGMGVGLSVSRSIIESHRGRIWATPNDGVGTTLTFSLPTRATRVTV